MGQFEETKADALHSDSWFPGSELKEMAERLRELTYSEERYRIAAENSSEIILDYNLLDDSVCFATARAETIYGIPMNIENARDYLVRSGVVQPESEYDFLEMFQRLREGMPRIQCTVKMRTAAGEFRWNEIILSSLFNEQGQAARAIGVMRDITQQKEVELQYENELLYREAMKREALLTYEMDLTNRKVLAGVEASLTALNHSFTDDYDEAMHLLISNFVHPDDQDMMASAMSAENLLSEYHCGNCKLEYEYRKLEPGRPPFWVRGTVYITEDRQENTVRAFYYVHDINDAKLEELHLREKAERDLLTGLYNKGTTEQLIQHAIAAPLPEGRISAFFIVDLDNFKRINDQLGHAFGDVVLSETAQKLQGLCRSDDIAGRIGGDEFALYLKNLPDRETAELKARRICEMFRNAYSGALQDMKISGTVGVALFPTHAASFEELYHNADLALYSAKNRGKDSYCVYSGELSETVPSEMNHAVIDNSSNKSFSENVIEYVFHILYESHDLQRAVNGILELVTKHFGFSRGYIYEYDKGENCFSCSYEWCIPGVRPLTELQPLLSGKLLEICRARFTENRLYVQHSPEELSPEERKLPSINSIFSRIQYSLVGNGYFHGFVGFDRYSDAEADPSHLTVLQGVAQLLDIFLAEKYASEDQARTRSMLQAVADCMRTCTYVIDPATYVLQFTNRSTHESIPVAQPGTLCYKTIRGRTSPCPDCPVAKMISEDLREYRTEMFLEPYHFWAKVNVSLIKLSDGKDYALFTGYDFAHAPDSSPDVPVCVDAFTTDVPLYNALSHSTEDYLFLCDMSKDLFYFPQAMVEDFDLPGQIIEHAISLWSSHIHPHERPAFLHDISDMLSGQSDTHCQEYRALNKDGRWVWLRCRGHLQRDAAGNPALFAGIITNLEKKGIIDPLSGLPNKYEFERKLREVLSEKETGWLLLLGLDNFKNVNGLYGWEFGDRVIREAAQKMLLSLPDSLPVFRLDGDKFGIFCTAGGLDVETVFRSVSSRFQVQQQYEGRRYYCTLSGGWVTFQGEGSSFTSLFRQAEHALDFSKSEGKNCLSQYSKEYMGHKDRILTLIERLHESVDQDCADFELYYQPQVDAHTQKLCGAEALLRWHCEEYGSVPPTEFIPLLEQTGLIHTVGRWVLLHAAHACHEWRSIIPDFSVNVNLSFAQLQDRSFLPYLAQLIVDSDLDSSGFHLELTESCIAAGSASLTEAFRNLRGLGFCLEMDDFGTGYSSLEILKNAPADVVKIDRAFVAGIAQSDFDATFIQFIVSLCHSVGIKVCLEGVETWEEYRLVKPMGLDLIQGYLFGRPQSRDDFEAAFIFGNASNPV